MGFPAGGGSKCWTDLPVKRTPLVLHPDTPRGREGGRPSTLPLLEEPLASFLQGQHLGKGYVLGHVSFRNGVIFGQIFQEWVGLEVEVEKRALDVLGVAGFGFIGQVS